MSRRATVASLPALAPAWCALALVAAAQDADAPSDLAPFDPTAIEARFTAEPTAVAVGEPMLWTLDVVHPAGHPPVAAEPLELDLSWAVLDALAPLTLPFGERPGVARTRFEWRVVALEPGALDAVAPRVEIGGVRVGVEPLRVTSTGVLREGEDEPRAPIGFRPVPGEEPRAGVAWLAPAAAGAALLLALGAFVALRRRRSFAPAPAPTFEERFAALSAAERGDSDAVAGAHFALAELVREAGEARLGFAGRGCTDDEWLALAASRRAARDRPEGGALADVERVLARCAAVKFAGERPTAWAFDETLELARGALDAFARDDAREGAA